MIQIKVVDTNELGILYQVPIIWAIFKESERSVSTDFAGVHHKVTVLFLSSF
jgi:hypothetical protein